MHAGLRLSGPPGRGAPRTPWAPRFQGFGGCCPLFWTEAGCQGDPDPFLDYRSLPNPQPVFLLSGHGRCRTGQPLWSTGAEEDWVPSAAKAWAEELSQEDTGCPPPTRGREE